MAKFWAIPFPRNSSNNKAEHKYLPKNNFPPNFVYSFTTMKIMKNLEAGIYIKSTAALIGSFFENTTILIVQHNEEGSLGLVTNKPFGKSLHELIEFNHSKPFPIMDGGPVDRDHIFVLHKRPDLIDGGENVHNGLYLGGQMEQVIEVINTSGANQQEIQLYIGYCGWDKGELEEEVEEGSWIINDLSFT
jgi:putative transcriptional regulator